ncbi:MAG: hypothetical protein JNK82_41800 [Myxococcaceae bacterium]|nr:hypothetical protein [Myxococcaceae bacterium]
MSPAPPSAGEWLEAMEAAATEVLSQHGGELPEFEASDPVEPSSAGAYISLVGPLYSVRLGVVAPPKVLRELAAIIARDEVAVEDVEDATRELANVLGGNVRKFLNARAPELTLGLPVFSTVRPQADRYDISTRQLNVAGLRATLMLVLPKAASGH